MSVLGKANAVGEGISGFFDGISRLIKSKDAPLYALYGLLIIIILYLIIYYLVVFYARLV